MSAHFFLRICAVLQTMRLKTAQAVFDWCQDRHELITKRSLGAPKIVSAYNMWKCRSRTKASGAAFFKRPRPSIYNVFTPAFGVPWNLGQLAVLSTVMHFFMPRQRNIRHYLSFFEPAPIGVIINSEEEIRKSFPPDQPPDDSFLCAVDPNLRKNQDRETIKEKFSPFVHCTHFSRKPQRAPPAPTPFEPPPVPQPLTGALVDPKATPSLYAVLQVKKPEKKTFVRFHPAKKQRKAFRQKIREEHDYQRAQRRRHRLLVQRRKLQLESEFVKAGRKKTRKRKRTDVVLMAPPPPPAAPVVALPALAPSVPAFMPPALPRPPHVAALTLCTEVNPQDVFVAKPVAVPVPNEHYMDWDTQEIQRYFRDPYPEVERTTLLQTVDEAFG